MSVHTLCDHFVCIKQLQPVFLTKQSGKYLKLKEDANDDNDDNYDDDFLHVCKWQTHSLFFVFVCLYSGLTRLLNKDDNDEDGNYDDNFFMSKHGKSTRDLVCLFASIRDYRGS